MVLSTEQEIARRKGLFEEYRASDEYREKLITRLKINDVSEEKIKERALIWNLCTRPDNPAEGCIFFIENFGWTFDPRPQASPNHLPMILFEYQKDAIRALIEHIDSGKDMLFEKSRDMGASWLLFVYVPLWYWLFRDGVNILVGSYKEKLVDDRSKDSIFGMLDYAIESLPLWMLPKDFSPVKNRTMMKLINPDNNNQISGDTMNPNFGRGSRKTAVLFDELGFWDYAKDAWEGTSDVTACRIANSTPNGFNYYEGLRNSGIDVYTMHWRQHPLKDELWYEYEKARRTPEEVAQELDISYSKSLEGRVYPEWNENNVVYGYFPYSHDDTLYVSWDFGKNDDTAIIWAQVDKKTGRLRIVDTYSKSGHQIEFFIPFITGVISMDNMAKYSYTAAEMEMIDRHKYWQNGTHFGDPAGRFESATSDYSVTETLKHNGIIVNYADSWKVFQKRKASARLLIMDGVDVNKDGNWDYFNRSMIQSSFPKVRRAGVEETNSKLPVHNWASHFRSSFEYLSLGLEFYQFKTMQSYDKFKPKEKEVAKFGRKRAVGY